MKQLGEKVKELRKKKGWSQEDLAREIDVSLSAVQRWEKRGVSLLALPVVSCRSFSKKWEWICMSNNAYRGLNLKGVVDNA